MTELRKIPKSKDFNPRLREGGDSAIPEEIDLTTISIHASAKEATGNERINQRHDTDFNPRLREGGDHFFSCSTPP